MKSLPEYHPWSTLKKAVKNINSRALDRAYFTVSVDPMRVVTVPNTVNGKTGLMCRFIGTPIDLERLSIPEILEMSKVFPSQSYPEALDSPPVGPNGPMKSSAKNMVRAA